MSTKNIALLINGAAFTNYEVSGIYNPSAASIDATVIGSIDTYQADAYKPLTSSITIAIAAGHGVTAALSAIEYINKWE